MGLSTLSVKGTVLPFSAISAMSIVELALDRLGLAEDLLDHRLPGLRLGLLLGQRRQPRHQRQNRRGRGCDSELPPVQRGWPIDLRHVSGSLDPKACRHTEYGLLPLN